MWEKLRVVWQIPELRKKILLTLGLLAVYRLGFQIPLPIVDPQKVDAFSGAGGMADVLKVLGDGELKKKLKISAHRFSASAKEKIGKAGGEMVLLAERTPVEDKKREQRKAQAAAAKAK